MRLFSVLPIILFAFLALPLNAQDTANWSFDDPSGPDTWASLSSEYAACSAGNLQSPINIEGTEPVILNELNHHYSVTPIYLKHEGYQITQRYNQDSILSVGDHTFTLTAIKFRTPSEHKIAGNGFPMEIQFYHESSDNGKAIISIMVKEGADNLAVSEYLPHLPLEAGQSTHNNVLINARDLMPFDSGYYRYNGSLTVPPCSEDVRWYIMKAPVEMSATQINAFHSLIGDKTRPVQARNNRIILDSAK